MLGEHLSTADSTKPIGIEKRQWSTRIRTSFGVKIQPGNSSDRDQPAIEGRCRDVSATGCGILSNRAPRVGDVYLLDFDKTNRVVAPSVYGRCVRCHLLSENAFESGFAFFADQDIENEDENDEEAEPLV